MTLEQDFLATAADKLTENLGRIETCVTKLPVDSLWTRDSDLFTIVHRREDPAAHIH